MLGGLGVTPYKQLGYCLAPDGVKFNHRTYSALSIISSHNVIVMTVVKVTALLIVSMLFVPIFRVVILSQELSQESPCNVQDDA